MFAQGDGPAPEIEAKISQDGSNIQLSAKASGSHRIKWEGSTASTAGNGGQDPSLTTFKVLMPDGKLVTIQQVITLSRVASSSDSRASADTMSLSTQQFGQALMDGVDFRNIKSKRIEKESQTYGRVNTKSAAKPQRLGDSETKEKVQDRRRQRDAEVRSTVEKDGGDEQQQGALADTTTPARPSVSTAGKQPQVADSSSKSRGKRGGKN